MTMGGHPVTLCFPLKVLDMGTVKSVNRTIKPEGGTHV